MAALGIQNKKRAFAIKTSIKQTRFTKKDLNDLKKRFEKNSTWVLVNGKGQNLMTQDHTEYAQNDFDDSHNSIVNDEE